VKKFLSLPSLAALAIALGMISWGSALNAQSTPSTTPDATQSQQAPSTQQPPAPETPPASQQTPSSQSGSQSPDATAPNSQSGSQSPDATTPRTQTPSSQSGSQSQTPDTTAPESGSRTGNANGAATGSAAGDTAGGAQTFTGTVVKQGDKYVLKDDAGKTYDIDHQTDVAKFEGKRVRVQGTLDPSGKIMVK